MKGEIVFLMKVVSDNSSTTKFKKVTLGEKVSTLYLNGFLKYIPATRCI